MKQKATVLAVEDLRLVARDLESRLKRLGYEAAVVSNGYEALSRAEALRPQIVLMDIVLEGDQDGIAVAEEMRRRFGVPVIFLTAHADEETVRRAQRTGPADYLLKPFHDGELDAAIQRVLMLLGGGDA